MRLWSIHPQYLDRAGLIACWREALLAQKVLANETKGYRNHPQLIRFRKQPDPLAAIGCYLHQIQQEGARRGYHLDATKIRRSTPCLEIPVTYGQLQYEMAHLRQKLNLRAPDLLPSLPENRLPLTHPLFSPVPGDTEEWERITIF